MPQVIYTDETLMPFGKYKGTPLANVPNDYLLWLYENGKTFGAMKDYLQENIEAIRFNIKQQQNKKK